MNQLTHEQLDLIKRLQPLFKEKMGEWKEDDYGKYGDCDPEVMVMYIADMNSPDTPQSWKDIWLRIPKPIDWQNPERGCWGMIDWSNLYQQRHNDDGKIAIYHTEYVNDIGRAIVGEPFIVADPFTALLIALVQQEGV